MNTTEHELTDLHKTILRMRDNEGRSFVEIGRMLSIRRQKAHHWYGRGKKIQKRLTGENRPRSVDVDPVSAHRDGRAARLMGYECDKAMPHEWQRGWVVADRAVQMGVLK